MTEACLYYQCSSASVMAEQMRHLLSAPLLASLGLVPTHHVAPYAAGHAFHIYGEDAVVVGIIGAKFISTAPVTIRRYVQVFEGLRSSALFGEAARPLIEAAHREYDARARE